MFFPEDFHILRIAALDPTGQFLCLEEIRKQHTACALFKTKEKPNSNRVVVQKYRPRKGDSFSASQGNCGLIPWWDVSVATRRNCL